MSLTSQQYADLAEFAYDYDDKLAGLTKTREPVRIGGVEYKVLEHVDNHHNGYQGTIFQRVDTGELIVAHRGTEPDREIFKDGVVADGLMVTTRKNIQANEAIDLTRRAMEIANDPQTLKRYGHAPEATVTGHSLGGTLAQISGHHFNLRGETFNAYGAASLNLRIPKDDTARMVNHVMATDVVSAASPHYGQVRVYATQTQIDALREQGGYANNRSPLDVRSPVPVLRGALDYHGMHNFRDVDGDNRSDVSVLRDSRTQDLAAQFAPMIDKYRTDVERIRSDITLGIRGVPGMVQDGIDALRGPLAPGEPARREAPMQQQSAPTLDEWLLAPNRLTRAIDPEAGIPATLRRPEPSQLNAQPQTFTPLILEHLQDFRHPEHPQHGRYQDVLGQVHRMEQADGIQPGPHSERMAAAWVDQFNRTGTCFDLDRFEMRGHDVVALERRDNYFQTPREASLNADQALSRPVEQVSAGWAQRVTPHLGQAQGAPQQSIVVDARQLPDHDLRRPDRAHHGQFEDLRSQVADLYAKAGIARDESQLERATAAVALDMQKYGLDRADRLFLTPDRSGMIGPDSGISALQGQYPLQLQSQTSHETLQQAPEQSFEQWQQVTQQVAEQQQQQAAQQQGLQRG